MVGSPVLVKNKIMLQYLFIQMHYLLAVLDDMLLQP